MVNVRNQEHHPGMDTKNRVALRVKTARKQQGLTQEKLAELIDRSVDTISLLERGQVLPSFETLERLSERLNLPLRDLLDAGSDDEERVELETALMSVARGLDKKTLRLAVEQIQALGKLGQ